MKNKSYSLEYISTSIGLHRSEVLRYVEKGIVTPFDEDQVNFDSEDLARLNLIAELKDSCSPNDESLQVILHLVDQVNYLMRKLEGRHAGNKSNAITEED